MGSLAVLAGVFLHPLVVYLLPLGEAPEPLLVSSLDLDSLIFGVFEIFLGVIFFVLLITLFKSNRDATLTGSILKISQSISLIVECLVGIPVEPSTFSSSIGTSQGSVYLLTVHGSSSLLLEPSPTSCMCLAMVVTL